jgi:hypothetical protein
MWSGDGCKLLIEEVHLQININDGMALIYFIYLVSLVQSIFVEEDLFFDLALELEMNNAQVPGHQICQL